MDCGNNRLAITNPVPRTMPLLVMDNETNPSIKSQTQTQDSRTRKKVGEVPMDVNCQTTNSIGTCI